MADHFLSDSNQSAAFDSFAKAASYLIGCTGAVLWRCEDSCWSLASTYGEAPSLSPDESADRWLKMVHSYGEVVDVTEVMPQGYTPPKWFNQIRNEFLLCIAIRNDSDELIGVVLVLIPLPRKRLSAAQIYALQTYATELHRLLDQKHMEMAGNLAFLERLRLLESVVVHAKDAILITEAEPIDLPGPRIVYCNPAFLTTTGFSLDEVIGMTPRILQCEETSREALQRLREALQRWEPVEVELINARRDGTRFWVQLSIVPVANEKGWFTHWISVQRDVTERKMAEQSWRQAQQDREERLALQSRLIERERIQEELTCAAFHDELTKLKNRAYLIACIRTALNERSGTRCSTATILYLDLDRFKYVNDGLGHHAGDLLLKRVAERLNECVKSEAVIARIGGDEFAILHTGERHQEYAIDTARRITQALSLTFEIEGQLLFTSCSIGIVTLNDQYGSVEELIRDADVAMYAAKKKGRGRWAVFDLSMRQASIDMLVMQNALKQAIARNEFYLVYQPIFSVTTEKVTGFEALVRWSHPTLGNVAPDVFIGLAEDIGVIYELGTWVMRTACREASKWNEGSNETKIRLNVNVSGIELNRRSYSVQIAEILAETGFDPSALQIELTESVFLHEPELVVQTLQDLRILGIRIALDDFGTGYSSLSYIDRYPIDVIKIDRSFISRMMEHERSVAIVKSILSLGQTLNLAIVAEGIETQDQLLRLKNLGCPYGQGFLLSPPLLPHDGLRLLEQQQY